MNNKFEQSRPAEAEPTEQIISDLFERMPDIARTIIDGRKANENFKENPDDPAEHEANWHQFGIITHTKKMLESYQQESNQYFDEWQVTDKVSSKLEQEIDGKTKDELLQISMVLHDLGKFARGLKVTRDNRTIPNYESHEGKSEEIIKRHEPVNDLLKSQYKLTDEQIEYIARCSGLHYELGKLREVAKRSKLGLSIKFAESKEAIEQCQEIGNKFSNYKEEIGIMFLADTLAKTDLRIKAETDQDIRDQKKAIQSEIKEKDLKKSLTGTAMQQPISVALARAYLETI